MRHSPSPPRSSLPRWLTLAGSALLLYHLAAVGLGVLDAPSGPWPGPMGGGMAIAPAFAHNLAGPTTYTHGKLLKVAHSYHYFTNRTGTPSAFLEVRLKDNKGEALKNARGEPLVLRFPEKDANPWVRHRQGILARQLADDLPVEPPTGEVIAPPGGRVPTVDLWEPVADRRLTLRAVPQHLVPRDRPGIMGPSAWEMLLARAYARHLCRSHGAASAEIVRHTRETVPPVVLFNDLPPANFEDLVASYGEVSR